MQQGPTDVDDSWFVDRLNSSVSEWSGLVMRIEPSREALAVAGLCLDSTLGNRGNPRDALTTNSTVSVLWQPSCCSVMSFPICTTGSGDDTTTDCSEKERRSSTSGCLKVKLAILTSLFSKKRRLRSSCDRTQ